MDFMSLNSEYWSLSQHWRRLSSEVLDSAVLFIASYLQLFGAYSLLLCIGIVSYTNDVCQHKAGEAFGLAMVS